LSGGNGISLDVAFDSRTDTSNAVYQTIQHIPLFDVNKGTQAELDDKLSKGRISALINIRKFESGDGSAKYDVHLKTSSASQRDIPALQSILRDVINNINSQVNPVKETYATISKEESPGRKYRTIDFYLPGMLGFSLIGSAVLV
jgi:ABC-2 type transport system permease protein